MRHSRSCTVDLDGRRIRFGTWQQLVQVQIDRYGNIAEIRRLLVQFHRYPVQGSRPPVNAVTTSGEPDQVYDEGEKYAGCTADNYTEEHRG